MPIKVQTNIDYEALCKELGVTIDELIHLVKNKDQHLSGSIEKVSLIQVIGEYIENLKKLETKSRRSNNTLVTYLNFLERVKSFVNKKSPDITISEINEDMIFEILEKCRPRKNTKLSTNTVNKYMAIIRSMLGYAFEHGYTEKDLRYKFSLKSISTLPRYLNDEQIEKVLKGALQKTYGYRKRAMILFLLGTGCRVSELTNIRVSDFIVDENLIFIRNGKGNKERYIPMFKKVKKGILHYLKLSGVTEWRSDIKGYLFCQDDGLIREKKVLDRSVQLLVRDLFDSIGLGNDFTVHSFRHTFAVKCLKSGIKEQYLMQMLGHEDPKTTSIYTKLLPQDLKDEVMKFYPFPFEELLDELI
ncbi:tyrosine-type recombinase/integrase [Neobacillus sp. PS3-12]|uniref:tyrosine-type recombinase/integrase n=1 Tax=Neobacillus sp. PS3-12 TaxID=3070677 RepID=UPI0027DFC0D5|nr:tyrosine-type recombinase/integrase [Neobacillus sp. PS3-12]WML52195.1 tyrosine-type recombinase/integrase [Neobacillus sp. PS3-12]